MWGHFFVTNMYYFQFLITGKCGYHMYKSIPLGEVDDVLPYLSRRAQENKTVFHRLTKEKRLIRDELRKRMLKR